MIICAHNQLPIVFFLSKLVFNKTLKARNSTPAHMNLYPLIFFLHIKSEQKVIRKKSV